MPTYYNVKVELDPCADSSAERMNVVWESGSSEFVLSESQDAASAESASFIEVGPNKALLNNGGELLQYNGPYQFGIFGRRNDNTHTPLSGSDGVALLTINNSANEGRIQEFKIHSGSGGADDINAFSTFVPIRITNPDESDPEQSNFDFPGTQPNASSFEQVEYSRRQGPGLGAHDITTISIPDYFGSSSFTSNALINVSSSCTGLKIEHSMHSRSSTRAQYCTHYFTWYHNSNGNAIGLRANTIENARSPLNEYIIDPTRTTGSFTSTGDFVLSVYEYSVTDAYHVFRWMTL